MSLFCSSRGSIQSISLIILAILVLAGAGYFGYNYYLTQSTPPVTVAPVETNSIETQKTIEIDTTSKEVLVSGIVGDVYMVTASGDIDLRNDKIVLMEQSTFYTAPDSRMALIFSDRSVVRLDANTRVSLEKGAEGNIVIAVQSGRIWARIIGSGGGKGKMMIVLGKTQAIVQGTSLEAVNLPLYSKYVVIDSSSSDLEIAGIDVIDSSGTVTRVTPEYKWIGTEFGTSMIKSINVDDIYENNAFVLMNTQEDIVHLEDALVNHSGSIDIEKVNKEILASIPALGTEESIAFFSGTTISAADLSGDISPSEWSLIMKKVLIERMEEYTLAMKQNNLYLAQISQDQEKIFAAIVKTNSKMSDDSKEFMEGLLREQETLLSNIMMQNQEFVDKINQDVGSVLQNLEQMIDTIVQDSMNVVDTTVTNMTQGLDDLSSSIQGDSTVTPTDNNLDSLKNQDAAMSRSSDL